MNVIENTLIPPSAANVQIPDPNTLKNQSVHYSHCIIIVAMAVLYTVKNTGMKKMKQQKEAFVKRIQDEVGKHRKSRLFLLIP